MHRRTGPLDGVKVAVGWIPMINYFSVAVSQVSLPALHLAGHLGNGYLTLVVRF